MKTFIKSLFHKLGYEFIHLGNGKLQVQRIPSKYPVYLFHHIPKCAGSTVLKALPNWFDLQEDYIRLDLLISNENIPIAKDLRLLNSSHCIAGHFELPANYLSVRYPDVLKYPKKYKVFTFIREPLELRISLYYYEVKRGRRKIEAQPLSEYLLTSPNYIAQRFPCTEENFKEVLDRYFFIGLQEELQSSMDKLAKLLKKRRLALDVVNTSQRDEQYARLDQSLIAEFKKRNSLDYAIYEYAKQRFYECQTA